MFDTTLRVCCLTSYCKLNTFSFYTKTSYHMIINFIFFSYSFTLYSHTCPFVECVWLVYSFNITLFSLLNMQGACVQLFYICLFVVYLSAGVSLKYLHMHVRKRQKVWECNVNEYEKPKKEWHDHMVCCCFVTKRGEYT